MGKRGKDQPATLDGEHKKELDELVTSVKEMEITEISLMKIMKKRKTYWWKSFSETWNPLVKMFNEVIEDPKNIKEWFAIGMTILLPKTIALEDIADYRPIICLDTIYKIFTGHANDLCDKCQLGAQKGVLGTTDQLLTDNCILEEVKEHRRNLAVSYYDYKKAYARAYHDWMMIVLICHEGKCEGIQCH